jgi:hypothetical protein
MDFLIKALTKVNPMNRTNFFFHKYSKTDTIVPPIYRCVRLGLVTLRYVTLRYVTLRLVRSVQVRSGQVRSG